MMFTLIILNFCFKHSTIFLRKIRVSNMHVKKHSGKLMSVRKDEENFGERVEIASKLFPQNLRVALV